LYIPPGPPTPKLKTLLPLFSLHFSATLTYLVVDSLLVQCRSWASTLSESNSSGQTLPLPPILILSQPFWHCRMSVFVRETTFLRVIILTHFHCYRPVSLVLSCVLIWCRYDLETASSWFLLLVFIALFIVTFIVTTFYLYPYYIFYSCYICSLYYCIP